MVKHELPVMSYKLRLESLIGQVEIQKCEYKSTSYEFEAASSNPRVTNSNPRATSLNPRVTSSNQREPLNQWKLN